MRKGARPLALLALLALAACSGDGLPNTAPSVPPPPTLTRSQLGAFELRWPPSRDDQTPADAILYEVGIVSTDVCLVVSPQHRLRGRTDLATRLPTSYPDTPFAGFTVRALDAEGRSAGYGPCVWGLREPLHLPIGITAVRPGLRPAPPVGPDLACQSDGHDGIWCEGEAALAHFRVARWQVFPLPQPFTTEAWTPLDDYNALVRSDQVQLHLSRANGTSASVLSSSAHHFDPAVGGLGTGHQRGWVSVRGFVAEFDTRYIDMAGPPRPALELPGPCDRLIQLGAEGRTAFALCASEGEQRLFVGEPERRSIHWRTRSWDVPGDRVEGLIGVPVRGLVGLSSAEEAWLLAWDAESDELVTVDGLTGEGRPVIAVSGTPDRPFVVAMRHFDYRVWEGAEWQSLPEDHGRVAWGDGSFPEASHLVGTPDGAWVISPERTVRLGAGGVEMVTPHPGPARAVRGLDGRTYVLRGPELREVVSSREGIAWFDHGWEGPPLAPLDIAVTPSGGIWVSGTTQEPGEPATARPTVRRLGEEMTDRGPPMPSAGRSEVPHLAADGRGRIYAHLQSHVAVLDPGLGDWNVIGPVPGELIAMVGLESGALIALQSVTGPTLFHCQAELCFEVPTPVATHRPWGLVQARPDGFCVGVRSRALWCREGGDDRWLEIALEEPFATRYGLRPEDTWDVVGALEVSEGSWLLALSGDADGFLVSLDASTGQTRLLSNGLEWGDGDVLLPPDEVSTELGRVVGIEVNGPIEIRYGETRVSVPGTLYR